MEYPDDFPFDLVIYDFTCGPCVLGFLQKFNYPPLVSLTGFSIPQFSHHLVGGHKPSSYVPHFSLRYDTKMDFFQRMINFIVQNFDSIYREWVFLPHMQRLAQTAFNFTLPNLAELEQRTQIMLVNTNPVLDPPETLPQNVIPVGGLQIVQPKPLVEVSRFKWGVVRHFLLPVHSWLVSKLWDSVVLSEFEYSETAYTTEVLVIK